MDELTQSESDLKIAVSDYLEYGLNQGKWYFDRLNSGEVIVVAGESRRRVKLCREGTADFLVIKPVKRSGVVISQIIFLELKSGKGRSSPEQRAFKVLVESQGASYRIIKSLEELQEIIPLTP